jgi:hypothetical protein
MVPAPAVWGTLLRSNRSSDDQARSDYDEYRCDWPASGPTFTNSLHLIVVLLFALTVCVSLFPEIAARRQVLGLRQNQPHDQPEGGQRQNSGAEVHIVGGSHDSVDPVTLGPYRAEDFHTPRCAGRRRIWRNLVVIAVVAITVGVVRWVRMRRRAARD